jgi:hypothetical protein
MSWQQVEDTVSRIVGPVSYPAGYEAEGEVRCLIWLIGLERANAIADELEATGHLNSATFGGRAREEAGEAALRYPFGSDYAWNATDRDGHIASFVSFIRGPIPLVVLEHEDDDESLWEYLQSLPRRSGPRSGRHENMPIIEEEQGLFLYDWGHQGEGGARDDQYERTDVPELPVTISEIPEPYAEMIRRVQFSDICFADYPRIDLHQLPPYAPVMPTDDTT